MYFFYLGQHCLRTYYKIIFFGNFFCTFKKTSIFAPDNNQRKEMRSNLVNTYWWWRLRLFNCE